MQLKKETLDLYVTKHRYFMQLKINSFVNKKIGGVCVRDRQGYIYIYRERERKREEYRDRDSE